MTADTATYVYCLVARDGPPPLADAPEGIESAGRLRVLAAGPDRWLVVADAPLARYSAEGIERGLRDVDWVSRRAMEHERVVESFLDVGTVVPMKLFTLFSSDARAVADVRRRRTAIDRALHAIAGRREWGVRVLHDPTKTPPASHARGSSAEPVEPQDRGAPGTAFLERKRQERDAARRAGSDAREKAQAFIASLSTHAVDVRRREPVPGEPVGRLVADAAFLVPEEAGDAFCSAVRSHGTALAAVGLDVVLSGPWPAYHFITEVS